MSDDAKYISDGQQRLLGLIKALAGHEVNGLAPAQIAKANNCSAPAVTRDLANLKAQGFAEQITDTGRWRLGPAMVQIATSFATGLTRASTRLAEVQNRYTRSAD